MSKIPHHFVSADAVPASNTAWLDLQWETARAMMDSQEANLDLLHTAGLLAGIEKYSGNIIYKRSSSPKFQVHNTALISAQSNDSFAEIQVKPNEWGRLVESAIGAHLINHSLTDGFSIYYWRERNEEVDFVLEKKGKVVGLEVKSGSGQSRSGITAFEKEFDPYKVLLVGNSGMPWQDFLRLNPGELF